MPTTADASVELRIVSRSDHGGRVLHRESLTLRSARAGSSLLPTQMHLFAHADLVSMDGDLPILVVAGPLVRPSRSTAWGAAPRLHRPPIPPHTSLATCLPLLPLSGHPLRRSPEPHGPH